MMAKSLRESLTNTVEGKEQTTVEKWTAVISTYEREFAKWEKRSDKILKRYRDDDRQGNRTGGARFNILWSNVQTLLPAVFSRIPQADVSRRFKDNDATGRVASIILERAISYEMEHYPDFRETIKSCVFDRFLGGRGTAWIRYEPHIRARAMNTPVNGVGITDDAEEPLEELEYECAPIDYVHWKDFGHTVARTWEETTAVWRVVYLNKDAAMERFGEEKCKGLSFDSSTENKDKQSVENNTKAEVYEIWDKSEKKAIWISKSLPEPLDELDDPLGLDGFYPCPKPLYATITNESLVPVPDFSLYQDQARELDTLAERIDGLIQSLQIKGVYDDSIGALARIFTEGQNGTLIPVKNWAAFSEKNGLKGAIDLVDLKPIYEALRVCFDAAQGVLKHIYDLTGLSDIVRGQSNANETATAQRIKGQYASLRLKSMQMEVARFATEIIQLKSQVICGKFDPKTIAIISAINQLSPADQQLIEPAMMLLVGQERLLDPSAGENPNPARNFRIEVNADTMVEIDEQQEKENRVEFIQAQAQFMEKALPMAQASPEITPLIAALWKFGVQAFKVGKTIEGEFDKVIDQLTQDAQQPKPPPPPNPAQIQADSNQKIEQGKAQFEQQKIQAQNQFTQQLEAGKAQAAMQMKQMDAQTTAQAKQAEYQAQAQMRQAEMNHALQLEASKQEAETQRHMAELQAKAQTEQAIAEAKNELELKKIALQVAGQIEVANINSSAKAKQDAESAMEHEQAESVKQHENTEKEGNHAEMMQRLMETQIRILETISAPKQVIRD